MPLLFKDDTREQEIVNQVTPINLKWDPVVGFGLLQSQSVLSATPISNPKPLLTDSPLYTPPFSLTGDHSHKFNGQNAIRVDLQWDGSYGAQEKVFTLEGAVDYNGPWSEVARIGAEDFTSVTRTNVFEKQDVRSVNFGSGLSDDGGFAKPQITSFENITGYKHFSAINWGVSITSYAQGGVYETRIDVTDADIVSFYYINGSNLNGGVQPGLEEQLRVELIAGNNSYPTGEIAGFNATILGRSFRDAAGNLNASSEWINHEFDVRNLSGVHTLRFQYKWDGPNPVQTTPDVAKHRWGISNITAFKQEEIIVENKRKFYFTFDDDGIFDTVEASALEDPNSVAPTLYVRGRETDDHTFKWYRMSVRGNTLSRNIVNEVQPEFVLTPLPTPLALDNGEQKWWLPREVFVKNLNVWTKAKEVYVKRAGEWEKAFPNFITNTTTSTDLELFSAPQVPVDGPVVETDVVDARVRIIQVTPDSSGVRDWILRGDNGHNIFYDGAKPPIGDLLRKYIQDVPTYSTGLVRYYHDSMPYNRPVSPTLIDGYDLKYYGLSGSRKTIMTGSIKISAGGTSYVVDTFEWRGYFVPKISGMWRFGTGSDDGSGVWLGRHAVHGGCDVTVGNGNSYGASTRNNALVQNLYQQRHRWRYSEYIQLAAGVYYPIWILWYENRGSNSFSFGIVPPDSNLLPHQSHHLSADNDKYKIVHRGSGWR